MLNSKSWFLFNEELLLISTIFNCLDQTWEDLNNINIIISKDSLDIKMIVLKSQLYLQIILQQYFQLLNQLYLQH